MNQCHTDSHHVTDVRCLVSDTSWGCPVLEHPRPTETHVRGENTHGSDVEQHPAPRFEHFELQTVDVSYLDIVARSFHPEKTEAQHARPNVDQVLGRAQITGLRVPEAELEQMDGHESEKCLFQLPRGNGIIKRDIASPLQCNSHVQQCAQQHVLLNFVCLQTEPRPVQTGVEISVPKEISGPQEDLQVADCVDYDKDDGSFTDSNTTNPE